MDWTSFYFPDYISLKIIFCQYLKCNSLDYQTSIMHRLEGGAVKKRFKIAYDGLINSL